MSHIEGLDAIQPRSVGDVDVAAAQRTAARYATDAADLRELLDMLGIRGEPKRSPKRPVAAVMSARNTGTCAGCGVACGSKKDKTWKGTYYGGRGMCERCYTADRRKRAKERAA